MPNAMIDGGTNGATPATDTVGPPMGAQPNEQSNDHPDCSHLTKEEMIHLTTTTKRYMDKENAAMFKRKWLAVCAQRRAEDKAAAQNKDPESTEAQTEQTGVETGAVAAETPLDSSLFGDSSGDDGDEKEKPTDDAECNASQDDTGVRDSSSDEGDEKETPTDDAECNASQDDTGVNEQDYFSMEEYAVNKASEKVCHARTARRLQAKLFDNTNDDADDDKDEPQDDTNAHPDADDAEKEDKGVSKQGQHFASQLPVNPMTPNRTLTHNRQTEEQTNKKRRKGIPRSCKNNDQRSEQRAIKRNKLNNARKGGSRLVQHCGGGVGGEKTSEHA